MSATKPEPATNQNRRPRTRWLAIAAAACLLAVAVPSVIWMTGQRAMSPPEQVATSLDIKQTPPLKSRAAAAPAAERPTEMLAIQPSSEEPMFEDPGLLLHDRRAEEESAPRGIASKTADARFRLEAVPSNPKMPMIAGKAGDVGVAVSGRDAGKERMVVAGGGVATDLYSSMERNANRKASAPASNMRRGKGLSPQAGQEAARQLSLGLQSNMAPGMPGVDGLQRGQQLEQRASEFQVFGRPLYRNPLGSEQYEAVVENDFLPAATEPLSTFSIDVDTASYANVRRFLVSGRLPPPAAVRIEEMVNYFHYNYPEPDGEHPFSVNMEVAQCPWNGDHRLVRIGLKGRDTHRKERGPSNLVFLLDVSGSMSDENKLPLVKQAMRMLVDQLGEDDRVAIVTCAGNAGLALPSTNAADENQKAILQAIDALSAGGSTHGSAGIQMAYDQAAEHFLPDGTNRVLLATDGDLNVGVTDDDQLVELIREKAQSGVFLTVLGFGTGNLKDAKLEKLADHGNGSYAYIDSLREAYKVMVEQATGSLVTIAKDVKIQVEFNPAEVRSYRLIGYENRVLAAEDFADDTKDAGEIGAGHTVTSLYEIEPASGDSAASADAVANQSAGKPLKYQRPTSPELTEKAQSGELLTLYVRYKQPQSQTSELLERTLEDSGHRFGQASDDFRFAAAVAAFGMVLRGSQYTAGLGLSAAEEFAAGAIGPDQKGYRREFVDLVRAAKAISATAAPAGVESQSAQP